MTIEETFPQKKLPFVWELNNHGVISYAIGTMHVMKNQYAEECERYLSHAPQLLLERTFDDSKKDPQLIDIPFSDIVAAAKTLDIDINTFMKIPPELQLGYLFVGKNYRQYAGVDLTLSKKAAGLPRYSLETPEERREAASYMNIPGKIKQFIDADQKNPGDGKKLFAAFKFGFDIMMDLYEQASLPKMELFMLARKDWQTPELRANMKKRNRTMVARAMPHLEKPSVFAVGCAHFLLEESVLEHFERQGIKTELV